MVDRKNEKHKAFIRTLPCAACGQIAPSECAHLRVPYWANYSIPYSERGATGLKPHDKWTVPLCGHHHRQQHADGEITFWHGVNLNPVALAQALYRNTGKPDACRVILRRARMGKLL